MLQFLKVNILNAWMDSVDIWSDAFLILSRKQDLTFMQTVSDRDNLHGMSNPIRISCESFCIKVFKTSYLPSLIVDLVFVLTFLRPHIFQSFSDSLLK